MAFQIIKKTFILFYLAVILITYGVLVFHIISFRDTIDFVVFYYAAKHFFQHQSLYSGTPWHLFHLPSYLKASNFINAFPTPSLGRNYTFNLNPPVVILLTLWLGFFSYSTAAAIWYSLIAMAIVSFTYLLYVNLFDRQTLWSYLVFLELFLAAFPTFPNLTLGQVGMFLCLITFGIWILARRQKDIQAGVLLGLILSTKYFLGLLWLMFFLQRRWRLVITAALTFLILNGITLAVFGKQPFIHYQEILHVILWYINSWNASLYGFFGKFGLTFINGRETISPIAKFLSLAVSAVLIGYQIFLCRKPFANIQAYDSAFVYTLIISILICPLGWIYYLVLMVLPILVILRTISHSNYYTNSTLFVLIFTFMLGQLTFPGILKIESHIVHLKVAFIESFYFYGMMMLLGVWWYVNRIQQSETLFIRSQTIFPWILLGYLVTLPSMAMLIYSTFFKVPRVWI
jgi:hypothetical protein